MHLELPVQMFPAGPPSSIHIPTIVPLAGEGEKGASVREEPYRENPRHKMRETEVVLNVFCSGHGYPRSSLLTVNASSGNCRGHS